MTKFIVTLQLIVGYYDHEYNEPRLRNDEYQVEAEDEKEAVEKAKELDKTGFSIWDHYVTET